MDKNSLFEAALEQVKCSTCNLVELLGMVCNGVKEISAVLSRMLASQVRFMHIQEILAKRTGDYVSFESFNVEKEILLCILQNEKLQNDLNAIQDYLQDLAGFLLEHLKTLFCEVLSALNLNAVLELFT